nr:AAA domain-containing protein [Corynebacterium mendelii]
MSRNYCLTDSQRTAVHGFLASGSGEVTAVTGPPGTGKTTMLQSVVANLLTRHALTGKRPPVIVGTSTNNQAVTNIISSFSSVAADNPGPWETRWLPAKPAPDSPGPLQPLKSLAVYCPSKAKLDRAEKQYLVETPGRQKTYADYTAPDYLEKAEDYFVSRFTEATGTHRPQLSIREVKNIIHGHLVEIDRVRCTLIDTMAESGPGPKFSLACAGLDRLPMVGDCTDLTQIADCTSLTELDRVLDTTLRYAEFWLAAHYWEATWLEEKDRFFDKNERFKTTGPFNDTYWSQAPCLTPCFVMTVYQLPKYFHVYTDTHHPRSFDLNRIDLLIVDEAGQVGAPLGLPAFALADRALVVGDEKQLSPIWTLTETTDCEIARKSGISDSAWQNNLKKRGLTASNPSNLMRVASHAGRWCHGTAQATTQPGLLLLEHFRCHPDIIGFSNKLLYDGLLKPSRPKESFRLTDQGLEKHIQFITLPASKDTRLGNSRYNTAEARAVADWIVDNYAHLHAMYHPGEPVAADELIAVVTPFKPQVDKIRKAISKAVDDAPDEKNLPADLATAITVGTAHALQGAERPVVVFSPVYGENSAQSGFIDDHPQLMNVAVSRARDLFVVIGAPVRWNRGPVFSVLARHAEKTRDVFPHCTPAPGVSTQPETSSPGAPEPPISATGLLRRWQAMNILHDNDTLSTAAELNQRLSAAGVLQGGAGHWSPTPLAEYLGAELQPLKRPGQQPVNYVLYNEQLQEILTGMYLDGKLADTTNP